MGQVGAREALTGPNAHLLTSVESVTRLVPCPPQPPDHRSISGPFGEFFQHPVIIKFLMTSNETTGGRAETSMNKGERNMALG